MHLSLDKIREVLLEQPVIYADETILQVLKEKSKPAASSTTTVGAETA